LHSDIWKEINMKYTIEQAPEGGWVLSQTAGPFTSENMVRASDTLEGALASLLPTPQPVSATSPYRVALADMAYNVVQVASKVEHIRTIASIKAIRAATGAGLKESKDAFEYAKKCREVRDQSKEADRW